MPDGLLDEGETDTTVAVGVQQPDSSQPEQPAIPFGSDLGFGCLDDRSQADLLVHMAESAELFHTPAGVAFADVSINGHRETLQVRHKTFRQWLTHAFYRSTLRAPGSGSLQAAICTIEAKAQFTGAERPVNIRIGGSDNCVYIDLGDKSWRAIEVDDASWRVINKPLVRFRRAPGMQSWPTPMRGGSIELLRPFLNLQSDDDFVMAVAFVLAALRDRGPYPVLVLSGEQGAAKSTFVAVVRALIDPNTAPLRALPRHERDLFIAAGNSYVQAFDNVSNIPPWLSDALCRLATGGSLSTRQLRTDQDEVLLTATRPMILNGIENCVLRPDLADRCIFLNLEHIPDDRRRAEKEFWDAFELRRPYILGALLDAMAHGLERLPETRLETLPRMADFAVWLTACETALWPAGTFSGAYDANRATAIDDVIDADPVAMAVCELMALKPAWKGTATDLLAALNALVGKQSKLPTTWPGTPRALSGRLRRFQTILRKIGIDIAFSKDGHARMRLITILKRDELKAVRNRPHRLHRPQIG